MKLIIIEGIDGSGKTTMVLALSKYLKSIGKTVLIVREPGGTNIGEKIREILLNTQGEKLTSYSQALLFFVAREQLYENLKNNYSCFDFVIFDRSHYSTYAYQIFANNDISKSLYDILLNEDYLNMENYIFFMNNNPQAVIDNTNKKFDENGDNFESKGIDFQKKVYVGYLDIFMDNNKVAYLTGYDIKRNLNRIKKVMEI